MDDSSGYFGSKPMTLDLLGLGGESSTAAYLTCIGNQIDVVVATFEETSDSLSWDGQAAHRNRKPHDNVL